MPKIVDREKMQKNIMDAAVRVYLEKGYNSATIADIATSAGLGKGTLYLYYKNKESLAASLLSSHFERMENRFFGQKIPDTLETFAKTLNATMKTPDEDARLIRLVFEVFGPKLASDKFASDMGVFFDRLGVHYAKHLQHLQNLGKMRKDVDPKHLGRVLVAMIDGIIVQRSLFSLPERQHAKMRAEFADLFVRGLR